MLPNEDGLSLCRRVRAQGNLPVIMLTARGSEIDRVVGLEMGADDYLTKPFGSQELVARIRALLRRSGMRRKRAVQPAPFCRELHGVAVGFGRATVAYVGRHPHGASGRGVRAAGGVL